MLGSLLSWVPCMEYRGTGADGPDSLTYSLGVIEVMGLVPSTPGTLLQVMDLLEKTRGMSRLDDGHRSQTASAQAAPLAQE